MSEYISSLSIHPDDLQAAADNLRSFWTTIFAEGMALARKAAGLSIEDTAQLAGMEVSEWMALEAGSWLPRSTPQLRAIAGALDMEYDRLAGFVLLCRSAWEA